MPSKHTAQNEEREKEIAWLRSRLATMRNENSFDRAMGDQPRWSLGSIQILESRLRDFE